MIFTFDVDPSFIKAVNNEWVQVEAVRFRFNSNQTVEVDLTSSFHNAKVMEQFLEPNKGKPIVYQGTMPV